MEGTAELMGDHNQPECLCICEVVALPHDVEDQGVSHRSHEIAEAVERLLDPWANFASNCKQEDNPVHTEKGCLDGNQGHLPRAGGARPRGEGLDQLRSHGRGAPQRRECHKQPAPYRRSDRGAEPPSPDAGHEAPHRRAAGIGAAILLLLAAARQHPREQWQAHGPCNEPEGAHGSRVAVHEEEGPVKGHDQVARRERAIHEDHAAGIGGPVDSELLTLVGELLRSR
mmetsp:Transcript_77192/g.213411  ORF Transcript_77192/g.213411 Transcript_77192/m.213411 type:complete len:228 (+) Transcript_77192:2811-3494(+)